MSYTMNIEEYNEAWIKAEREALINQFQADIMWLWAPEQEMEMFEDRDLVTPKNGLA